MMKGWKEVELNEVAPYWVEKIDASELDETNFISADNMKTDKGGIVNSDYVPKSGKSTHFERNDILISNIRPYFKKIWFAKFDGGCSNDVIVFRTNREIADSKFIYYYLSKDDFFDYLMAGANGTKMPRGNKKSIPMYKINLPPLPTQRKIAETLSAYDDLIENNLKRIKLLEEKAQLTYEEWFVRMKFPGHETTPINEETGLPEGWVFGTLSELINYQSGYAYKSSKFTSKGYPIIKIKNIVNNTIDVSNTIFIEKEYAEQTDKFKLNAGDLLIAMTGATVGKVGVVPITNIPCYLNQRVGRFLKYGEVDNTSFINCFFTIGSGLDHVMNIARGAAQPNISSSQILSIESVIPPIEILKEFSDIAINNAKEILNFQKQNQLLKEARDLLLPRLMTGMIDVDKLKGVSK